MTPTTIIAVVNTLGMAAAVFVCELLRRALVRARKQRDAILTASTATTVEDLDFVGTELLVTAVLRRHDRAAFVGVVFGPKDDHGRPREITTRWQGSCKCGQPQCRESGFAKPDIVAFVNILFRCEHVSQRVDLPPDQRLDQHKDAS